MKRGMTVVLLLLFATATAQAQSEGVLREAFEGKRVVLHQDMPATQLGVDVSVSWSGDGRMAVDSYSRNLRTYGVSLQSGASPMVTKVKVKGDMIEFQLDGGGYGVFGDITDPTVTWTPLPKSNRERDLERQLDYEESNRERDRITRELNDLRRRRDNENNRRRREAEEQTRINAEAIASRRAQGGSRFNLHFPAKLTPEQMRPDLVVRALAEHVSFPWLERPRPAPRPSAARPAPAAPPRPAGPPPTSASLKKGMSLADVEHVLGQPTRRAEKMEGSLKLQVLTFETATDIVEAQFLDAVLVRYSFISK
jgi:hypothetical protein